jgi:hypothetical protein
MKFSVAAAFLLAALADAKVILTNSNYVIKAGEPFTFTWTGNTGPVTLTLKNGPNTALKTVQVIDRKHCPS